MLKRMNRGYTREWYLNRIDAIKTITPECTISTDLIIGFCDETDKEHQDTISLVKEVGFSFAYMYKYSERPNTAAEKKYSLMSLPPVVQWKYNHHPEKESEEDE